MPETASIPYALAMERLVEVIQELSLARDLPKIMAIVRHAARELTGADGATFVLREDGMCHYADEEAISPLWKGQKFPMSACISGWAMLNRQPAVIEDIYADPRIPADAYRPTFVKSLVMVPIRTAAPIGAIGNYWAMRHHPAPEKVRLLQALADSTSIAMENVALVADLEHRVSDRTAQLEEANRELESFSYSVSHDLRAPLRSIDGFSRAVLEDYAGKLDEEGRKHLDRICTSAKHMNALIEGLLDLSRKARQAMKREPLDLTVMARELTGMMQALEPSRKVRTTIAPDLAAKGDKDLVRSALQNLISNAWKFTSKTPDAAIEVGRLPEKDAVGKTIFFIRDNGAGFDMTYADRLFGAFQRLHRAEDYPGTGVGLATVQRIFHRHNGRIWAESQGAGKGAAFYFTLAED